MRQTDNSAKQVRGNFEHCTGAKGFASEGFKCEEYVIWKHGLCELLTQF